MTGSGAPGGEGPGQGLTWERVRGFRPRLRAHAGIQTHRYRGRVWYVLQDRVSNRHYRFSASVKNFLDRLDGRHSVQQILDELGQAPGGEPPAREEVVTLLSRLHAANLLQGEGVADGRTLSRRHRRQRSRRWRQRLLRPLALRFPLADPDRFLARTLPLLGPLFSRAGLLLWAGVVIAGIAVAVIHWQALSGYGISHALETRSLLQLLLVYPVVKAVHEFAHAVTAKRWGGEVHEAGIMLLVLMPIPYVDATSANGFPGKWQRILTDAAGIMAELFLAACATLLWVEVQPGPVRDIAFSVMLIGGVSTLLFNGNPLLRYDGYYVLSDWLEIPNLGSRSIRYLGYLLKRHLFGMRDLHSPATTPGERFWFLLYGPAAFCYRLFISVAIALFVAGKFFAVGVILALWALGAQLLLPLYGALRFLFLDPSLVRQGKRLRALSATLGTLMLVAALLWLVPVPVWTRAEGVLELPEQSMIRARGDGFVDRVLKQDGDPVRRGERLFRIEDPLLPPRIEILTHRIEELEARRTAAFMNDRNQAGILEEEIAGLVKEREDLQERLAQLTLRSPVDGIFRISRGEDLPGRFVRRGELLGHVVDDTGALAQVVVPQEALERVRGDTRRIEVRLPGNPGESLPATILGETPSLSYRLPNPALGSRGGGAITVDAQDSAGLLATQPIYRLELRLPPQRLTRYIGSRLQVRFDHGAEPLARQWLRRLRQLFLRRLDL